MSHGFSRILADQDHYCGVNSLVMDSLHPQFRPLLFDNARKKIRENPRKSVAKVSA